MKRASWLRITHRLTEELLTGVECRPLIVSDISMLARRSAPNRRADQHSGAHSSPAPAVELDAHSRLNFSLSNTALSMENALSKSWRLA